MIQLNQKENEMLFKRSEKKTNVEFLESKKNEEKEVDKEATLYDYVAEFTFNVNGKKEVLTKEFYGSGIITLSDKQLVQTGKQSFEEFMKQSRELGCFSFSNEDETHYKKYDDLEGATLKFAGERKETLMTIGEINRAIQDNKKQDL